MIDEHCLASELEMRVRVVAAITPAPPRERLLLRNPEHHDPRPAVALSLLHPRTCDVLLDHVLGEPHHRDRLRLRERVEILDIRAADLSQQRRRRRDAPTRPLIEEPHQQPIGLQRGHIPG